MYPEEIAQEQIEINPQQEEEERWLDRERIQSSPEEQREKSKTPEELFVEHFELGMRFLKKRLVIKES